MTYNMTSIMSGNETSLLTFVQGVNTVLMGGMLGNLLMIGLFMIIFIAIISTTNDFAKALTVSCFISFILSLSLLALNLINPLVLFITLIGSGVGAAIMTKND